MAHENKKKKPQALREVLSVYIFHLTVLLKQTRWWLDPANLLEVDEAWDEVRYSEELGKNGRIRV